MRMRRLITRVTRVGISKTLNNVMAFIYAYFFSDFLRFDMSLLLLTVTLQGVSNKHCLLSLFSLFLMGFFSYLQVMMTYIRARIGLKLGLIRPWTAEFAALKHTL